MGYYVNLTDADKQDAEELREKLLKLLSGYKTQLIIMVMEKVRSEIIQQGKYEYRSIKE
jgi:hypothetical protein